MTPDAAAGTNLHTWLADSRAWVDAELAARLPGADAHPASIHEAMHYALFGGGKRLRPALVRMVCESFGGADADAAPAACAVELVHTYSLVHDDLPCMDDDDLRRGRPTVHVRYDEATAVLVGDALLTAAFGVLAESGPHSARAASVLARAAGTLGMVGGQVLDLRSSERAPELEEVREIHRLKTAAMIAASAELGAVAAGADEAACRGAAEYGRALGLLFQAVDDCLDVTGTSESLGKTPGKDEKLDRGTLVAALGLEGARREARGLAEEARSIGSGLGWAPEARPLALVGALLERQA